MKDKSLFLVTLAMAILATGCKQSNSTDSSLATNGTASMSDTWANTKGAAMQAWVDMKTSLGPVADYTYEQKDVFMAKASADLDALDRKIGELSDQAAKVSESAKADAQVKLQGLHNQRAVLGQRLDNVTNATAADWNDAKTAFENSYGDVKNSLKQAWQWFKNELNP